MSIIDFRSSTRRHDPEPRRDQTMGEYKVVGKREYRGHAPGEIFEARIDRAAAVRAVARGDIRLLRMVVPVIQPGTWTLPDGWLSKQGKE